MDVYKYSCSQYMYDNSPMANPLIRDRVRLARQRDILSQSLTMSDIDPQEVMIEFDTYMRSIFKTNDTDGLGGRIRSVGRKVINFLFQPAYLPTRFPTKH